MICLDEFALTSHVSKQNIKLPTIEEFLNQVLRHHGF
jgi:hypothetical protein